MNRLEPFPKAKRLIAVLALAWYVEPVLPADGTAVATAAWTATEVTFSGASDHEFLLKVTGPSFTSTIRGRGSVNFQAEDKGGQPLPDGIYRYELIGMVPGSGAEPPATETDPTLRAQTEGPMRGEGRWATPASRLHDLFRIENTAIVPPADRPRAEVKTANGDVPEHGHDHTHSHSQKEK